MTATAPSGHCSLLVGSAGALKSSDDKVGGTLDPLLGLLAFEHPVLLDQAPPQPGKNRQRYDGDPDDQRYETSRRKRQLLGGHYLPGYSVQPPCAASVAGLCRLCRFREARRPGGAPQNRVPVGRASWPV